MKNLILHLGAAKTGTSTIQSALYASKSQLEAHGYYYPILKGDRPFESHHLLQALVKPHHKIGPYWRQRRGPMALMQLAVSEFQAALAKSPTVKSGIETTILSSELLVSTPYFDYLSLWLKREFTTITPLFYVRDSAPHYRSLLQQGLKAGEFVTQPICFDAIIDAITASVGCNTRVLQYVERCDDPQWDLLSDFWTSGLGLSPEILVRPAGRSNVADPAEVSVILALAAKHYCLLFGEVESSLGDRARKRKIISWMRNELLAELPYNTHAVTKFELSADSNQRIKQISECQMQAYVSNPESYRSCKNLRSSAEFQVFKHIDEMVCDVQWDSNVGMAMLDRLKSKVRYMVNGTADDQFLHSVCVIIDEVLLELRRA